MSFFKDSLLSEEQFVLHSIVDSLVAELDNSTIPNESTSQVNFKIRLVTLFKSFIVQFFVFLDPVFGENVWLEIIDKIGDFQI